MTLSEKQKVWHRTNKPRKREAWRKWYAQNREKHRKAARESYHRAKQKEGGSVPSTSKGDSATPSL